MTKNNIPVGTKFGQLTVLQHTDRISGNNHYFLVKCDCGGIAEVQGSHLLYSHITSCGCASLQRSTVDSSTRRLRLAWRHLILRCTDRTNKDYHNYGGRGISVYPEWLASFDTFKEWALANGYDDNLSIDRIDNDKNYCPANCQWATITQQNRNTRRVRHISAFGETKALSEWAADPRCQVSYFTLRQRITTLHWDFETALLSHKHERSLITGSLPN